MAAHKIVHHLALRTPVGGISEIAKAILANLKYKRTTQKELVTLDTQK
jgi:hypothetical protein